jgi:hypothetical protein
VFGTAGCAGILNWSSVLKSVRLRRSPSGDQGLLLCGQLDREWDARDRRANDILFKNGLLIFVAEVLFLHNAWEANAASVKLIKLPVSESMSKILSRESAGLAI